MRARSAALLWLLFVLCTSCDACEDDPPAIATLSEMVGTGVQRDRAAAVGQWERAAIGAHFSPGDGVRALAPSSALLDLTGGGTLRVRPGATVRFVVEAEQGESSLDVETGEALLISGAAELRLRTHVGWAVLTPGTQVRLGRRGDALDYSVEVGQASFRNKAGQSASLAAGESVEVAIGAALLRKTKAAQAGEPEPEEPPAETAPAAANIIANVQSDGVDVRASGGAAWTALERGEQPVAAGAVLRLPANAVVVLERGEDRVRLRGAGEFIVGEGGVLVEAQQGSLDVTASSRDVELIVPGGLIVALARDGGSRAHIEIGATSGTVKVDRGTVLFNGGDAEVSVEPGREHRFAVSFEGEQPSGLAPGPQRVSFSVRAGESFVVHAPQVPVAIGFDVSHKCSGEVAVDLVGGKQRGQGTGRGNLLLPAGKRAYTARCVEGTTGSRKVGSIVARGTVQVLVDAGTRKLPARAPTSQVDADGRTYSVYYQNQLPDIRVRWPNAPSAPEYTLDVDGKKQTLASPEHAFRSGTLRDGAHKIAFSAGERRSRTTILEVSFDNTAATASLMSPADRSFAPGEKVVLEGVVLPSWKVSVDGGMISMEGTEHFTGEVATSAERPDIAVRLSHPRLGTHYYVRRAAGSP